MQSSQEHQGIGSSGQSGSIRQESEQTLKSQVIDLIQLESETNRWHCLQGQLQEK